MTFRVGEAARNRAARTKHRCTLRGMSLPRWKRTSSTQVHENAWWRYIRDTFEHPNLSEGEYHYVSTHGSVMIIPRRPDGSFVMVEQFRFLGERDSLEFPAGGMHEHETPPDAARRELGEETGLSSDLAFLGAFCPWNGVTDELCHVYLATELKELSIRPERDVTEDFILHDVTPRELAAAIASGTLWDGMTLAAYAMLQANSA